MSEDLEKDDQRVMQAARAVKDDLPQEDTERLDELLEIAGAPDEERRSGAVDEIARLLTGHEVVGDRYAELTLDIERGVEGVYAPDSVHTMNADDYTSPLLEFKCLECGFANKLRFRPPRDEQLECQNPEWRPHFLRLD
jgi:hypothetical protein